MVVLVNFLCQFSHQNLYFKMINLLINLNKSSLAKLDIQSVRFKQLRHYELLNDNKCVK
tara:strand:+ start:1876 stop:2052 length:177 start_codon:yes stop_codon:yes gene_type:complete